MWEQGATWNTGMSLIEPGCTGGPGETDCPRRWSPEGRHPSEEPLMPGQAGSRGVWVPAQYGVWKPGHLSDDTSECVGEHLRAGLGVLPTFL